MQVNTKRLRLKLSQGNKVERLFPCFLTFSAWISLPPSFAPFYSRTQLWAKTHTHTHTHTPLSNQYARCSRAMSASVGRPLGRRRWEVDARAMPCAQQKTMPPPTPASSNLFQLPSLPALRVCIPIDQWGCFRGNRGIQKGHEKRAVLYTYLLLCHFRVIIILVWKQLHIIKWISLITMLCASTFFHEPWCNVIKHTYRLARLVGFMKEVGF